MRCRPATRKAAICICRPVRVATHCQSFTELATMTSNLKILKAVIYGLGIDRVINDIGMDDYLELGIKTIEAEQHIRPYRVEYEQGIRTLPGMPQFSETADKGSLRKTNFVS